METDGMAGAAAWAEKIRDKYGNSSDDDDDDDSDGNDPYSQCLLYDDEEDSERCVHACNLFVLSIYS